MASVYLAQLSGSAGFAKWIALKTIHPHIVHWYIDFHVKLPASKSAVRVYTALEVAYGSEAISKPS